MDAPRSNPGETPADPTESPMRRMLSSNLFRAGIVVLSAAIIFGAWAFAEHQGRDDDAGRVVELGLDSPDDTYEQARLASESGDTAEAIALLERVLNEDPDHAQAQALLRQLRAGDAAQATSDSGQGAPAGGASADARDNGPPSSGDGGNGSAPPGDDAYMNPVDDLTALLPAVISGWQRDVPIALDDNASVTFEPAGRSPVTRVLFAVNDRGTVKAAQDYIDGPIKRVYSKDAESVTVGVTEAYLGTDGSRIVAVAFARGRFAFEVLLTVHEGAPVDSRGVAIELANQFEAAR